MAVTYFTPDTPQQSNPILAGIGAAQNIYAQGVQNAYLPQTLQEQLALMKAQTGLMGAQTQYFPLTVQAQLLRGAGDFYRGVGLNSPGRYAAMFMKYPAFEALLSNNPQLQGIVANDMANAVTYGGMGGIPGLSQMGIVPSSSISQSSVAPSNVGIPSGHVPLNAQQQKTLDMVQNIPQYNGNAFASQPNSAIQAQAAAAAPGGLVQPSDIANMQNAMNSHVMLKTSDADTRKRNLFASNIEQTLQGINPDALTQYAGLAGQLKLLAERGLASVGQESPAYDQYESSKQNIEALTKQVRQFYGDSIQPSIQQDLRDLADTGFWHSNPQLAKQLYYKYQNILQNEMQTYRQALSPQSPAVYKGTESRNLPLPPNGFSSQSDFVAWYKSLTPQQRAQYKAQLSQQGGSG